ncbi:hypothetical protein [Natronomonas marina]|jgi:hypothetical protein|uniref:hypothetical protein n=1 Tax=Natronomonas marina TaxID=2961939 RepID=UPI0020C99F53|nr:hypothetical protein [Natronomonas marina]
MSVRRRLGRAVFGDRLGVVVFLAAVSTYLLCWRVGALITDTYTVANTLVAVSEGHLYVDRAVYGGSLRTPGMALRDGQHYGRNYGQVLLAMPFLWVVEALAAVTDLRVTLSAVWGLSLLSLSVLVGRELGRPRVGAYAGSAIALVAFVGSVAGATPVAPDQRYLLALQAQTIVAAAFVGVVLYRLLGRAYGRRVGVAAGLAVVVATPIGFWAQFPKRHVPVTLCAVASMYCLYRSREGGSVDTRFRALSYVPVGVAAWVSAAEGVFLLVALLAVDVPTGGRRLRSLATAGTVALVSTLPMFVTNYLVTGNPAEPPRTLSAGGSGSLAARGSEVTGGEGGGAGGGAGATGGGSAGGAPAPETGSETLDALVGAADFVIELYSRGIEAVLSEPETLYATFLRGGYIADIARRDAGEAVRLAFLEAMPLAAALVAVPLVAARVDLRARLRAVRTNRGLSALGTVDAFAVVYALAVLLVYLPRLPIHASITVRYLLALFPLSVYGLARIPSVRRVVEARTRLCAFSYAAGVFVGGQLLVVYLWAIDATIGEAVQTHALVGLGTAALVVGWAVADGVDRRFDRFGAVALGLAAAAGTAFVVLAGLWHFAFVGPRAVPFG